MPTEEQKLLSDEQRVAEIEAGNKVNGLIISPEIDALCHTVRALRGRLAACESSRRVHELDNHHNALACGYCAGSLKNELTRLASIEPETLTLREQNTALREQLAEAYTWIDRKNAAIEAWQQQAKENAARLAQVEQDRERLLRGDFTDDELQGFCHNLDENNRRAFFDGCTKYQERLFGTSAVAESRKELAK